MKFAPHSVQFQLPLLFSCHSYHGLSPNSLSGLPVLSLPVQQLPSGVSPLPLQHNHNQHSLAGVSSSTVFHPQLQSPSAVWLTKPLCRGHFGQVQCIQSQCAADRRTENTFFVLLSIQVEPPAGKRPRGRPRKWVSTAFSPFLILHPQSPGWKGGFSCICSQALCWQ